MASKGVPLIRVLIVDDHAAVRCGIRSILLSRADVEVCAEAIGGQDAINEALRVRPDLIVLDIYMPGMSGIELTYHLGKLLPETAILVYIHAR